MTKGTIFELFSNNTNRSGIDNVDALEIEERRTPGLPHQNGTREQERYQQPRSEVDFFDYAKNYELPKERGFLDRASDTGKNLLKASARGVQKLGRMMGPTIGPDTIGKSEEEIQQRFADSIDDALPSQEGGFISKAVERGLEQFPSMVSFPGVNPANMATRTAAAGFLGEGVKELGGSDGMQLAAELTAYLGPDFTAKLLAKGENKQLIETARQLGLSDKQITPLIQSEFKQKWLSKLSARRGRTQTVLDSTRQGLGSIYDRLGATKAAQTQLTQQQSTQLINDMQNKLFNMPSKVRDTISKDLRDLVSKPITGETIFNFWKDINANLGPETAQLANLKDSLRLGLSQVSPELANQFEWTNKLWGKYKTISGRLKPNLMTDILGASEAIKLMAGISFGYFPVIVEAVGEQSARVLSRELLLNPRFQNLSNKMVSALNQNKFQAAQKVLDSMIKEVKDISPEAAKKLQGVDFSEIANDEG